MLILTENATTVVKGFAEQIPDASGLRITGGPVEEPALEVTPAATPEPGDAVVEQNGATVFLDENATLLLDDKVLDAVVDGEGQVEFALGPQATA
ncbi:MAG: Fe-S cluster assembly protein HesB [Nocardioides sp.]